MAFPSVTASNTGEQATDSASHSIAMPAGIVAGDRIVCLFSCDCTSGDLEHVVASINTGVSGPNWTILGQIGNGNFNVIGAIITKIAEGGDVLTLTTSGITPAQQSSNISLLIPGSPSIEGTSFGSTGGSNSNPPAITPSAGIQDYLFIVTRSGDAAVAATVAPTSYSNLLTRTATNAQGASSNTAERQLNASTTDPGTFTSASEQYVCWTLALWFPPAVGNPWHAYAQQ